MLSNQLLGEIEDTGVNINSFLQNNTGAKLVFERMACLHRRVEALCQALTEERWHMEAHLTRFDNAKLLHELEKKRPHCSPTVHLMAIVDEHRDIRREIDRVVLNLDTAALLASRSQGDTVWPC